MGNPHNWNVEKAFGFLGETSLYEFEEFSLCDMETPHSCNFISFRVKSGGRYYHYRCPKHLPNVSADAAICVHCQKKSKMTVFHRRDSSDRPLCAECLEGLLVHVGDYSVVMALE